MENSIFFVQCTRIKQFFFQCLFGSFYVLFIENFLPTFLLKTETRSLYFLIFFAPFFNTVHVIIFNLILIFAWGLLFPRIIWLSLLLPYKSCDMIAWRILNWANPLRWTNLAYHQNILRSKIRANSLKQLIRLNFNFLQHHLILSPHV